jgi:hypothetical protein
MGQIKPVMTSIEVDAQEISSLSVIALERDLASNSSSFEVKDFIVLYQLVQRLDL